MSMCNPKYPRDNPDAQIPEDMTPTIEDHPDHASGNPGGDPEPDDSVETTYVAIEGVSASELTDTDKERIEKRVVEVMLQEIGAPISDVRVVNEDTAVVEAEIEDE